MNERPRIYFDNAATSWPKPEAVYHAVDHYQRFVGAPAGRSAYREASDVERQIREARRQVAELIGASAPERIIFTANGTDSLNLAIHGLLKSGGHVVTTVLEHNSVLRPLRQLESEGIVEVTRVACDGNAFVDPDDVRKAIRPSTRLVALIHVSNVTGSVQPVAEIARLAAERDLLFLLDAAQSLGHVPVDVATWRVPLLAAPGHKGLLAPLGTGVLYVGPGAERTVQPVRQGGTGTQSERDQQPESLPDRYEAGNHNVPGILGLREGTAFVRARGVESLGQHISMLAEGFVQGVSTIRGVRVVGPSDPQRRAGVVSITVRGYDAHEAAMTLDVSYAIQVRGGLHCAPLAHRALGTLDHGGTVRFSFGAFNTMAEVERGVEAVAELAASA